MITDKDITKLKKIFATKEELSFLTTEVSGIKNEMINFKDALLYEIQKLRDDIAVVIGYRNIIEDHEVRIDKLESKK